MRSALGAATLAVALLATSARAESTKEDWFDEACPDKAAHRWCLPTLKKGGWRLKYKTESPKELGQVSWLIEVWVRAKDALVCELRTGREGVKANGCYSLTEVK